MLSHLDRKRAVGSHGRDVSTGGVGREAEWIGGGFCRSSDEGVMVLV